jgi:DDE superfamily endonuclease
VLAKQTIILPQANEILLQIHSNPKFFPYFKDCVGALDGSHMPAFIPAHEQAAWRHRKGFLSQNVLGACNFDLEFVYVLARWEGSQHDGRVLEDSLDKGFQVPEGKCYLGDAGYSNTKRTLVPDRGVRHHHHLKEQARCGFRPANKQKLFSLRHATLSNAI